jgi:hypothetical protein
LCWLSQPMACNLTCKLFTGYLLAGREWGENNPESSINP